MGFSRDGLNFSCAGSEGPVLKFFQITSKISQGILKIPPNYLKKKTQMFSQILLKQFKTKTRNPRDSFKLLNQTQELLEILSNGFKSQTKSPRFFQTTSKAEQKWSTRFFQTTSKTEHKNSPRFFQTTSKTRHKGSLRFFQTTSKTEHKSSSRFFQTSAKPDKRDSRDSFKLLQKHDKDPQDYFLHTSIRIKLKNKFKMRAQRARSGVL